MNDENVLKQPKKPTKNNNNKFLLVKFNAIKIPKNNEAKTLTKKELLEEDNLLILTLYFINNLRIRPKVLPTKV